MYRLSAAVVTVRATARTIDDGAERRKTFRLEIALLRVPEVRERVDDHAAAVGRILLERADRLVERGGRLVVLLHEAAQRGIFRREKEHPVAPEPGDTLLRDAAEAEGEARLAAAGLAAHQERDACLVRRFHDLPLNHV